MLRPPPQPLTAADEIAAASSMINYSSGTWNATTFTSYGETAAPFPAAAPFDEGVEVSWTTGTCPTVDNTTDVYVNVRLTHRVPVFLPGLRLITGGSCDPSGCHLSVSATSTFRMEPPPA
jgi:hypothetical protein